MKKIDTLNKIIETKEYVIGDLLCELNKANYERDELKSNYENALKQIEAANNKIK